MPRTTAEVLDEFIEDLRWHVHATSEFAKRDVPSYPSDEWDGWMDHARLLTEEETLLLDDLGLLLDRRISDTPRIAPDTPR